MHQLRFVFFVLIHFGSSDGDVDILIKGLLTSGEFKSWGKCLKWFGDWQELSQNLQSLKSLTR